jgi:tetratricopeptide (TPR) repeat protein
VAKFLVSGAAAGGKREPRFVEADSVDAARNAARAAGLDDVIVHDDETAAALRERSQAELPEFPRDDPERELKLRRPSGARELIWNALKANALVLAACVGRLAWTILHGQPFTALDAVAGLLLGWLSWSLYSGIVPALLYRRIIRASALARYDEVLALIPRMRATARARRSSTLVFDLDFREATILAAQGRLDDALKLCARWRESKELQSGLYDGRLASIYHAARRFDRSADAQRRSLAPAPREASRQIDLAMTLALRLERYDEASELLDEAERGALSENEVPWARLARGAVLLGRGAPEAAVKPLEEALLLLEAKNESPLFWLISAWTLNTLAIALARCGDKDAARRIAARARPLLERHGESAMIAAADAALAG